MPLIECTLGLLANCGFSYVLLYCFAHGDQVRRYIEYAPAALWCPWLMGALPYGY